MLPTQEGKRQPGRPSCRWDDNTKMDLREIGSEDVDWIKLDQDRHQWQALVKQLMNTEFP
jgi:hypothetical protein